MVTFHMVILLHVAIAILSVAFTTFSAFFPSKFKLNAIYVLTALTLGSGTFLIFSNHTNMTRLCLMAILYIGFTVAGVFVIKKRVSHPIAAKGE